MSKATATLPAGPQVRLRIDRDGWIKRAFMAVIALYLVAALALPLFTMLSKSFVTYRFDLGRYEFQVSDEAGTAWGDPISGAALAEALGRFAPEDLGTSSDGRFAVVELFPDFSFRSPVKYRMRSLTEDAPYLVGLDLQ